MLKNTTQQFGVVSKVLHWIIALLVIVMLIAGYWMGELEPPLKGVVYNLHKVTGIMILCLMLIRLLWALSNPKPRLPRGTTALEHAAEWTGHFLLYVLIIAQPIVGWVGSVSAGYLPHIGYFVFSLPITGSKALTELCFEIHNALAIAIIVLISLHVMAALYHHFIRGDNVLKRMMP